MSNSANLSYNYAKFFFKTFKDSHLELIYKDSKLIKYCYDLDENFKHFIKNIVIDRRKKQKFFTNVFEGVLSKQFRDLIRFLFKNKKESLLIDVVEWIIKFYAKEKSIKQWQLVTAFPVDKELEDIFNKKMSHILQVSHMKLDKVVDPHIMGGFICRCEDKEIDMSVRKIIFKLKNKLS